jgi:hypothetical protein
MITVVPGSPSFGIEVRDGWGPCHGVEKDLIAVNCPNRIRNVGSHIIGGTGGKRVILEEMPRWR